MSKLWWFPGRSCQGACKKDKRANVLTVKLCKSVARKEQQPKTVLNPRDLSFLSKLVWKGKGG